MEMAKNLAMRKFVPGENNDKLTDDLKSELEKLINESFRDRGIELISSYFSLPLWRNFKYMILVKDIEQNNRNVGVLMSFQMWTPEEANFVLYDKIFMHPDYRGNEYYKEIIEFARELDRQLTRRYYPRNKHPMPSGLRTSSPELSREYQDVSDYHFEFPQRHTIESGVETCYVHLFGIKKGFLHEPIQEYISKMRSIASCIANLPPTMQKIERW